jgi:hypothetical protein
MSKYANFLTFLIGLGTKLPTLWPLITAWLAATRALVDGFKGIFPAPGEPGGGTLELYTPTADELALEGQVAALITPAGSAGAFDGSLLRGLFQFAKAHPELITFLLTLAKGG